VPFSSYGLITIKMRPSHPLEAQLLERHSLCLAVEFLQLAYFTLIFLPVSSSVPCTRTRFPSNLATSVW